MTQAIDPLLALCNTYPLWDQMLLSSLTSFLNSCTEKPLDIDRRLNFYCDLQTIHSGLFLGKEKSYHYLLMPFPILIGQKSWDCTPTNAFSWCQCYHMELKRRKMVACSSAKIKYRMVVLQFQKFLGYSLSFMNLMSPLQPSKFLTMSVLSTYLLIQLLTHERSTSPLIFISCMMRFRMVVFVHLILFSWSITQYTQKATPATTSWWFVSQD